jgi:hypothetical protein
MCWISFAIHLIFFIGILLSPLWPANTGCRLRTANDALHTVEKIRFSLFDSLTVLNLLGICHTVYIFTAAKRRARRATSKKSSEAKAKAKAAKTAGRPPKLSETVPYFGTSYQGKSNTNIKVSSAPANTNIKVSSAQLHDHISGEIPTKWALIPDLYYEDAGRPEGERTGKLVLWGFLLSASDASISSVA